MFKFALLIQTTSAASANVVDLEVRSNNDYTGPLFIGSEWAEARVIYDTMSDDTIILSEDSKNAIISGNYQQSVSNTSSPIMNMTMEQLASGNLGSYQFIGKKYRDNMCLS